MDAATLAAMNLPATGSAPEAPKPKAPTLKDYLPYMKPKTFGPKGQVPSGGNVLPQLRPFYIWLLIKQTRK